jgi:hypothetical protein
LKHQQAKYNKHSQNQVLLRQYLHQVVALNVHQLAAGGLINVIDYNEGHLIKSINYEVVPSSPVHLHSESNALKIDHYAATVSLYYMNYTFIQLEEGIAP